MCQAGVEESLDEGGEEDGSSYEGGEDLREGDDESNSVEDEEDGEEGVKEDEKVSCAS